MTERERITKKQYFAEVSKVLQSKPFNFTKEEADDYSLGFGDFYAEGDYTPEDAVYEDASYWD